MKRSGELEKWSRGLSLELGIKGGAVEDEKAPVGGRSCLAWRPNTTNGCFRTASATKTLVLLFTTFYLHYEYLRPTCSDKLWLFSKAFCIAALA
jgi:hypothetical protein